MKKTIVTIIGLTLGYMLIFILSNSLSIKHIFANAGLTDFQAGNIEVILRNTLIVILAVIFIKKYKLLELSGLSKTISWSNKYLVFIPAYLIIIGVLGIFSEDLPSSDPLDYVLLFISTMSVGFSEEFLFRGLICVILVKALVHKKNGIFLSVFITSLIFGVLHLFDFEMENIANEISQLTYAIYFGVFFGALLFRTNKLVPLAIIHGLINFVFGFDSLIIKTVSEPATLDIPSQVISAIVSSVVVLPLLIVGIRVIKKIKREDITKKLVH